MEKTLQEKAEQIIAEVKKGDNLADTIIKSINIGYNLHAQESNGNVSKEDYSAICFLLDEARKEIKKLKAYEKGGSIKGDIVI